MGARAFRLVGAGAILALMAGGILGSGVGTAGATTATFASPSYAQLGPVGSIKFAGSKIVATKFEANGTASNPYLTVTGAPGESVKITATMKLKTSNTVLKVANASAAIHGGGFTGCTVDLPPHFTVSLSGTPPAGSETVAATIMVTGTCTTKILLLRDFGNTLTIFVKL
jgi:hypothetical protein